MVNSDFHLFRRKLLPTNDELTVPDLYMHELLGFLCLQNNFGYHKNYNVRKKVVSMNYPILILNSLIFTFFGLKLQNFTDV